MIECLRYNPSIFFQTVTVGHTNKIIPALASSLNPQFYSTAQDCNNYLKLMNYHLLLCKP